MMPQGPRVQMPLHQRGDLLVRDHARALGVDGDVDRAGHADGIAHLDLALARQARGHDVLGHVARGVGGRAVPFVGSFAAEARRRRGGEAPP